MADEVKADQANETVEPEKAGAETFTPIQIPAKDEAERLQKMDALVKRLVGRFERWEMWRRPYEVLWDEIYKLYLQVVEERKVPTRAKIFIPMVFQIIEAAMPKILSVVFGNEEFFDVEAVESKDAPLAKIIKKLLLYQLGQADFFEKFIIFVKQLLLYGTSYFMVYWKVRRAWVFERIPIRQDVTILGFRLGSRIVRWEERRSYEVVERRPELDVLDILDVYPDPEARNEKEAMGIVVRSWIGKDELQELGKGKYPIYVNTDSSTLSGGRYAYSESRQVRQSSRGAGSTAATSDKDIELLSFWILEDLDGDGIREETQVVIANRSVLLRAMGNPFHHQKRPVIRTVLFPVPMEWFGIGLIEPIIPLQHEVNTLRRQRLDNLNLIINRMWKVNSYADVDLDTLVSVPNGIVLTDDMGAVEPLETANVTNQAYTEASIVQQDIENTTTPRSIQGTPESGRLGRTARGAQLIIGQALEKFGVGVKLVEEMGIKRMLRMFHQLNLQFISDDDVFRAKGMYGHLFDEKVTPEMIRAEVRFKMKGISEIVAKESQINQIFSFMGLFGKVLAPDSITSLAKKVWELMGFSPDEITLQGAPPPPELAAPPQPAAQSPEAAVMSQVLQNQAGGGAPALPGVGIPRGGAQ